MKAMQSIILTILNTALYIKKYIKKNDELRKEIPM